MGRIDVYPDGDSDSGGDANILQQPEAPTSPAPELNDLWIDTDESAGVGLSSIIGYAESVTLSQSIAAAVTELTGLSVTVTVPAGRRLRITGHVYVQVTAGAPGSPHIAIHEGGTRLGIADQSISATTPNINLSLDGSVVVSPTAGSHTYHLRGGADTGDTALYQGGASFPAYILVEDITGTLWPAGQSIDYGMMPVVHTCRVYNSVNISIPDATETSVTFDTERHDTSSMHSLVSDTNRITFPATGVYRFHFRGNLVAGTDFVAAYAVLQASSGTNLDKDQRLPTQFLNASFHLGGDYLMAAGDWVQVRIYQDNTANVARNLLAAGNVSPELSVSWVGPG